MSAEMEAKEVRSTGVKGLWSEAATWDLGVPSAGDIVYISPGDTVTIDVKDIQLSALFIGEQDALFPSRLKISRSIGGIKIRIDGNLTIADSSYFGTESSETGSHLIDTLEITGNIISTGRTVFRSASSGVITTLNVIFTGSGHSEVSVLGPYPYSGVFGQFIINKSGTGRVKLKSNAYLPGGSSSLDVVPGANPIIFLTRGIIETGEYALIHLWTTSTIIGGSDSSYILGTLGRGVSNSSPNISRFFPVGDEGGYRPVTLRAGSLGLVTGHHALVTAVNGNANPGSGVFEGGIDKVSTVRYYKISYNSFAAGAAPQMTFNRFTISYGLDDGVAADNQTLRIALDSSKVVERWTNIGPTVIPHTTRLDSLPRGIVSDSIPVIVENGKFIPVALARVTGSSQNSLDKTSHAVRWESPNPSAFALDQNFPNPFNPSTTIRFHIEEASSTMLTVYDALGRIAMKLINGEILQQGSYSIPWDAAKMSSGVYYYRLQSGGRNEIRKMMLMK